MFIVMRILFVLLVLGFAWSAYQYFRSRDAWWLRVMRWLLYVVTGILLVLFAGLFAERLFWS